MKHLLSAVTTLRKLHQQTLDQRALELTTLQARKYELDTTRKELRRRRIQESEVNSVEAMPYLTAFLSTMRAEEEAIEEFEVELDRRIEHQREDVLEAWQEASTTNHIKLDIMSKLRKEAEDREQAEIEERTIIAHARKTQSA